MKGIDGTETAGWIIEEWIRSIIESCKRHPLIRGTFHGCHFVQSILQSKSSNMNELIMVIRENRVRVSFSKFRVFN